MNKKQTELQRVVDDALVRAYSEKEDRPDLATLDLLIANNAALQSIHEDLQEIAKELENR
jgi:hypothetical protein